MIPDKKKTSFQFYIHEDTQKVPQRKACHETCILRKYYRIVSSIHTQQFIFDILTFNKNVPIINIRPITEFLSVAPKHTLK